MKNGDIIENMDLDNCPVHDAAAKNEYSFGRYNDAVVVTYRCGCAACLDPDSGEKTYFTNYNGAAGLATLIKRQKQVRGY